MKQTPDGPVRQCFLYRKIVLGFARVGDLPLAALAEFLDERVVDGGRVKTRRAEPVEEDIAFL